MTCMNCRECRQWRMIAGFLMLALLALIIINEIEFHKLRRQHQPSASADTFYCQENCGSAR